MPSKKTHRLISLGLVSSFLTALIFTARLEALGAEGEEPLSEADQFLLLQVRADLATPKGSIDFSDFAVFASRYEG